MRKSKVKSQHRPKPFTQAAEEKEHRSENSTRKNKENTNTQGGKSKAAKPEYKRKQEDEKGNTRKNEKTRTLLKRGTRGTGIRIE